MRTYARLAELQALVGKELGTSEWMGIEQERIDGFAQATGDHQWIHIDPVRAAAGPFGTTIELEGSAKPACVAESISRRFV